MAKFKDDVKMFFETLKAHPVTMGAYGVACFLIGALIGTRIVAFFL